MGGAGEAASTWGLERRRKPLKELDLEATEAQARAVGSASRKVLRCVDYS